MRPCSNLLGLCEQALSHLCTGACDQDCAIRIEADQAGALPSGPMQQGLEPATMRVVLHIENRRKRAVYAVGRHDSNLRHGSSLSLLHTRCICRSFCICWQPSQSEHYRLQPAESKQRLWSETKAGCGRSLISTSCMLCFLSHIVRAIARLNGKRTTAAYGASVGWKLSWVCV